jgi:hypothetical protein
MYVLLLLTPFLHAATTVTRNMCITIHRNNVQPPKGWNTNYVQPAYEYCHAKVWDGPCANKPFTGQCVIGGYIYRGNQYADLYKDQYIFADYQVGHIIRMYLLAGSTDQYDSEVITTAPFQISALAEDAQGELYILEYGDNNSMVWKLPGNSA